MLLSIATNAQTATTAKTEGQLTWYTDIAEANAEAKKSGKPLFAFFTGSDWCGWCRKLQADVFSKTEFVEWAKKNVVLVELDFPRNKPVPENIAAQNRGLQQALQVRGYPTIWLIELNKSETGFEIVRLGSLGYPAGSEQGKEQVKFLADADAILMKRN